MVHMPGAQHGIAGSLPVNGFRCVGLKGEGRCDAAKPLYMAVCDSTRNGRTFDPERRIRIRFRRNGNNARRNTTECDHKKRG